MGFCDLTRAARRITLGLAGLAALLVGAGCVWEDKSQAEAPHGRQLDYEAPYPKLGAFPPVPEATPAAERRQVMENLTVEEPEPDRAAEPEAPRSDAAEP